MKISKAVITAAGKSQRNLPLQRVVDRDGAVKSALEILIEEAASAGVEQICLVVCPGDEPHFSNAITQHASLLTFVTQPEPLGYGHALFCARKFVGADPFLHLVSDHLYVSESTKRCAQQLVEVATRDNCAVSAVQATRESMLPYFGTVGGQRVPGYRDRYQIDNVLEKPSPTEAEQKLIVPGLRAGHYLCLFGMHVLTPTVMDILETAVAARNGDVQLSPALAELGTRERYLALEVAGARYNIGVRYGLLVAQLAMALSGADRDEILLQLVELLAKQKRA